MSNVYCTTLRHVGGEIFASMTMSHNITHTAVPGTLYCYTQGRNNIRHGHHSNSQKARALDDS